jgi:multicomponent Na+:H+ antiporter subunit D
VARLAGTSQPGRLGGLYGKRPLLAALYLVPALSVAGIPPLSGFWGKLALIQAGLGAGCYLTVAAALGVSFLTLFYMVSSWSDAFWKERPVEEQSVHHSIPAQQRWQMYGPAGTLALVSLVMGLATEPFFRLSLAAAGQLLNPAGYISAVLGVLP